MLKLDSPSIFLMGGKRTVVEVVEGYFSRLSLLHHSSNQNQSVILLIERCDELISKECEDEQLVYSIATWFSCFKTMERNGSSPLVILTSSLDLKDLHLVWKRVDLLLSIPIEFNLMERLEIIKFFTPNMQKERQQKMAVHSGGFLVCDLYELASSLMTTTNLDDNDIYRETKRIKRSLTRPLSTTSIDVVDWKDIYGQEMAKEEIQQAASFLSCSNVRERYFSRGLRPPRGLLLYGPPGTGKTLLARATATLFQAHFITITLPSIIHSLIGDSEKAIRRIFIEAIRLQPTIIFIDEIDSLVAATGGDRGGESVTEKITAQLVEELDCLMADSLVLLIGATNLLENVHPLLRRYGRFDREILVGHLNVKEQALMISKELFITFGIEVSKAEIASKLLSPQTGAQVCHLIERVKYHFLADGFDNLSGEKILEIIENSIKEGAGGKWE